MIDMYKQAKIDIVTKEVDDDKQCSVDCDFCIGRIKKTNNVFCHIFHAIDFEEDEYEEEDIEYVLCEHVVINRAVPSDCDCKHLNDGDVINRHPNCIDREVVLE